MEQRNELCLNADAQPVYQGEALGLALRGKTRMAADPMQAALLARLLTGAVPTEALLDELCARGGVSPGDPQLSLALAAFILDFGPYLV